MDTWMNTAMLIEITIVSFLLALWMAWMSLCGLLGMLPGRRLEAVPMRPLARPSARAAARTSA